MSSSDNNGGKKPSYRFSITRAALVFAGTCGALYALGSALSPILPGFGDTLKAYGLVPMLLAGGAAITFLLVAGSMALGRPTRDGGFFFPVDLDGDGDIDGGFGPG